MSTSGLPGQVRRNGRMARKQTIYGEVSNLNLQSFLQDLEEAFTD